jgi:hypothetical protein
MTTNMFFVGTDVTDGSQLWTSDGTLDRYRACNTNFVLV